MYRRGMPDNAPKVFCDGYQAFKHGGHRSTKDADTCTKKWLQIRLGAYRRAKHFDPLITPQYLKSIVPLDGCCPVTRVPLTSGEMTETDWSIERANNREGYVPGNIIIISLKANAAKGALDYADIQRIVAGERSNDSLSLREWQRLAELVRPMHRTDDSGRGVHLLEGQVIAPGTPVAPVARFQQILTMAARMEMHSSTRKTGHKLACFLVQELSLNKRQLRAYRNLYRALRKRASTGVDGCLVWGAPRIQRMMAAFLLSLQPRDASRCLQLACTRIEDLVVKKDHSCRDAISSFSSSSVGRYSEISL
jgi:hypothetical protein